MTDVIKALQNLKQILVPRRIGFTETEQPSEAGQNCVQTASRMCNDARKAKWTQTAVKILAMILHGSQKEL